MSGMAGNIEEMIATLKSYFGGSQMRSPTVISLGQILGLDVSALMQTSPLQF